MLKTSRILILLISAIAFVSFCTGCSYSSNSQFSLNSWLRDNRSYEYIVSYSFSDLSDKKIIEQRLETFDFSIVEFHQEGSTITYHLELYYVRNDMYFEFVSRNYEAEIIDNITDDIIITPNDVKCVHFGINERLSIYVDESFADHIYEHYFVDAVITDGTMRFKPYPQKKKDNGEILLDLSINEHDFDKHSFNDAEKLLIATAVSLSSDPLKGEVTVSVIKSATPRPENIGQG